MSIKKISICTVLVVLGVLTTMQYSSLDLGDNQVAVSAAVVTAPGQAAILSGRSPFSSDKAFSSDTLGAKTDELHPLDAEVDTLFEESKSIYADEIYTNKEITTFLNGDPKEIIDFFENIRVHKENPDDFKIEHNQTLLQKVARWGRTDLVDRCLSLGANVNVQDDNGWTALHNAIATQSLPTVLSLVKAGADLTIKDKMGRSFTDFCQDYNSTLEIQQYIKQAQMAQEKALHAQDAYVPIKTSQEIMQEEQARQETLKQKQQEQAEEKARQQARQESRDQAEAKAGARAMAKFRQTRVSSNSGF